MISGSTDGMGRALASTYLDRGDTVVIIGRDAAKAATLPGAHFIPTDLSLPSENRRVLKEINARYGSTPLDVADVPGVVVAGVTIDAGLEESPVLLRVGKPHGERPSAPDDPLGRVLPRRRAARRQDRRRAGGQQRQRAHRPRLGVARRPRRRRLHRPRTLEHQHRPQRRRRQRRQRDRDRAGRRASDCATS
ncbi:hypothetical protein [Nonomuraea terrae]|uniref:hypothetical protein n=1 Tax=Nonomuraea terrae TaxID=2530383 RepID=UPI001FEB76D8|nr:hypothetical protein [Nonomuraea terrae]